VDRVRVGELARITCKETMPAARCLVTDAVVIVLQRLRSASLEGCRYPDREEKS